MPHFPSLKPQQVLRILEKAGFYVHHQRGSHMRLFHRYRKELKVTIPYHKKDIPRGTLKSILKQADLTDERFLELL